MAAKNYTNVDTGSFAEIARGIHANMAGIDEVRSYLQNQVLSGLSPCWQGEAKDAFFNQFGQFTDAFGKFVSGYAALTDELDGAYGGYERADAAVRVIVNGLPDK